MKKATYFAQLVDEHHQDWHGNASLEDLPFVQQHKILTWSRGVYMNFYATTFSLNLSFTKKVMLQKFELYGNANSDLSFAPAVCQPSIQKCRTFALCGFFV